MARILVAEDDSALRLFLARALERAGHEVAAVGDGDSAAAALDAGSYDMLLADIVMPGLDGIELSRRAAAHDPDLRILLITGFAAVALRASRTATDRARVISKPIHLRELVHHVEAVLADA